MKKYFLLALGLLVAHVSIAQWSSSLLWEVKDPETKKTSYLFGTYHLLGSAFISDNPRIEKAYNASEHVVVEMLVDSSAMMTVAMMGLMPGKSLKAMVDSADYALLQEKLNPILGMDLIMLDQVKPMVISTMYMLKDVESFAPDSLVDTEEPMDLFFAQDGKKQGKEVMGLETAKEQASLLFESTTVEEQAKMLVEMVKQEEEADSTSEAEDVTAYYLAEDLNKMWAMAKDLGLGLDNSDVLLKNRNENWIPKLKAPLAKGKAFIAVGALHLPGADGLIELLKAQGYELKPIMP